MDDHAYVLMQTNRERKDLSRSARHRKNGSRSRRCTLPSDSLTPTQKKGLNGMMYTYTMDKPHTLRELKTWPDDLRGEYMAELLDKYRPSNASLGEMLGVAPTSINYVLTRYFGISRSRGYTPAKNMKQILAWEAFITGVTDTEPVTDSEDTADLAPVEPEIIPVSHNVGAFPTLRGPIAYDMISLTFSGTADDFIRVLQTGPLHLTGADTYLFTITATRKEAI